MASAGSAAAIGIFLLASCSILNISDFGNIGSFLANGKCRYCHLGIICFCPPGKIRDSPNLKQSSAIWPIYGPNDPCMELDTQRLGTWLFKVWPFWVCLRNQEFQTVPFDPYHKCFKFLVITVLDHQSMLLWSIGNDKATGFTASMGLSVSWYTYRLY